MRAIHDLATPKRKQSLVRGNCRRQRTIAPSLARPRDRSPCRGKSSFISSPSRSQIRSVGPATDRDRLPSHVPNGQFLFPPLFPSCRLACFRALTSELIISRSAAFLIAVVSQPPSPSPSSSSLSSVDRPSKHDTFPLPRPPAALGR